MTVQLYVAKAPGPVPQSSLQGYRDRVVSVDGHAIPPTTAIVKQVYADCTADIQLLGGAIIPRANIASTAEFVVTVDGKTYGTKRLPQRGSRVIVDFLDGSLQNAVIRGSVFSRVEADDQKNILTDAEAAKDVTLFTSHMKETRDQATGNYLLEDLDTPAFHVLIDRANKVIEIVDWNGNIFRMAGTAVKINNNFEVDQ